MPAFTTEAAVRLKFQIEDTAVSAALVEQSIADAHTEVLARLDPATDTENPDDALVLGETLLAGAHLLAALASCDAFTARPIALGGQRVEAGQRFASLLAIAAKARREAWRTLAPYLAAHPPTLAGTATESTAILGD